MEDRSIPYPTRDEKASGLDEWRDCSGNFLRLSSYVARQCAGNDEHLAAPAGAVEPYSPNRASNRPSVAASARTSIDLGRWYYEQGRFTPIYYDEVADSVEAPYYLGNNLHRIKPGAVLWFSKAWPTEADGLEGLWSRQVGKAKANISHMATVVRVHRDSTTGALTSFEMYHGRRETRPGKITKNHIWVLPSESSLTNPKYPKLDYWGQYVVGIGELLPAEVPPLEG